MDSEQKSTEGNVVMHFNEWFVDEITRYPKDLMSDILSELYLSQNKLPELNGFSQVVFGLVKKETPFYFKVEYIKQEEEIATFLDILEVNLDDYLDAINDKKILNTDGQQESKEVKSNRKYRFSIRLDEEE
tara:strand:- start:4 stop:396 length:393 start_codon:yes stop_codon:yes gene_type:complete